VFPPIKDFADARAAWANRDEGNDAPLAHCVRLEVADPLVQQWVGLLTLVQEGGVRLAARDVHPFWYRVVTMLAVTRGDLRRASEKRRDSTGALAR
jgi:hypothetical protein